MVVAAAAAAETEGVPGAAAAAGAGSSVSVCTLVPVKRVKRVPEGVAAGVFAALAL